MFRLCVGKAFCLCSGGRRTFPLFWSRVCELVCFGMSVVVLSADNWIGVLDLLVVWLRYPVLGAAGYWVVPGLQYSWSPSWGFFLINTPWGQESSGSLVS